MLGLLSTLNYSPSLFKEKNPLNLPNLSGVGGKVNIN